MSTDTLTQNGYNMFGITEDGTYRVESIGFSTPVLTSGYVVAVRSVQHESDLTVTGSLFGRWTDEDGTVYWGEVEVIGNLWYALHAAYLRNELAIWDLAESRELRVADYYPAINFID